jgi:hypothetical protein
MHATPKRSAPLVQSTFKVSIEKKIIVFIVFEGLLLNLITLQIGR